MLLVPELPNDVKAKAKRAIYVMTYKGLMTTASGVRAAARAAVDIVYDPNSTSERRDEARKAYYDILKGTWGFPDSYVAELQLMGLGWEKDLLRTYLPNVIEDPYTGSGCGHEQVHPALGLLEKAK